MVELPYTVNNQKNYEWKGFTPPIHKLPGFKLVLYNPDFLLAASF